jgi:hypothetical protein
MPPAGTGVALLLFTPAPGHAALERNNPGGLRNDPSKFHCGKVSETVLSWLTALRVGRVDLALSLYLTR